MDPDRDAPFGATPPDGDTAARGAPRGAASGSREPRRRPWVRAVAEPALGAGW